MILLNLLIILLSIVIVLHLIKFLKERNKKREGFVFIFEEMGFSKNTWRALYVFEKTL